RRLGVRLAGVLRRFVRWSGRRNGHRIGSWTGSRRRLGGREGGRGRQQDEAEQHHGQSFHRVRSLTPRPPEGSGGARQREVWDRSSQPADYGRRAGVSRHHCAAVSSRTSASSPASDFEVPTTMVSPRLSPNDVEIRSRGLRGVLSAALEGGKLLSSRSWNCSIDRSLPPGAPAGSKRNAILYRRPSRPTSCPSATSVVRNRVPSSCS